jgi:hypothetical protein
LIEYPKFESDSNQRRMFCVLKRERFHIWIEVIRKGEEMKERTLIYQGDPCTMCLDDPEIQTLEDVRAAGARYCKHYPDRRECTPPSYGCVQVAGLKVARYVLLLYAEASEKTLAMEVAQFQERAPLPPEQVDAYIDTSGNDYRQITDPELVVQRVGEYARAVLDLKPGERIFRSPEEPAPPPIEADLIASQEGVKVHESAGVRIGLG